jgi:type IV pilus assembly protein PilA
MSNHGTCDASGYAAREHPTTMQSPSQYPPAGPPHQSPQKPSGMGTGLIVLFVAVPVVVAFIGVLAVLAIFGVRKYIAAAKSAEARNSVSMVAKLAVVAFEERQKLCPSASSAVPKNVPHGMKYQSQASDWTVDEGTDAGFACLKFSMNMPQYYQYDYQATATGFTALARGDVDGDGEESSFELKGALLSDRIAVAPSIQETNPGE